MRRRPPPLSVTLLPPSITTRDPLVLRTLAVAVMVIVTGAGPQSNVMIPPAATALTTAAEVRLDGVPWPITWSALLVSTPRASAGTLPCPFGFPGRGSSFTAGLGFGLGFGVGDADGAGEAAASDSGAAASVSTPAGASTNCACLRSCPPQPASISA